MAESSNAIASLDKSRARCLSGAFGIVKPLRRLDFLGAQFLLCKKQKKLLDLQVFSQIGKTMKKLQ